MLESDEAEMDLYVYEIIDMGDYNELYAKFKRDDIGYWKARLLIWKLEEFKEQGISEVNYDKTIAIIHRYRTENF